MSDYGYHVVTIRVLIAGDSELIPLEVENMVPDSEDFYLISTDIKPVSEDTADIMIRDAV